MSEKYTDIMNTVEQQEKLLRIDRFSGEEALALSCLMADLAKERGIAMGISICKPNGATVFQHLMDGADALNTQDWLRRKTNVVNAFEHSSMYMWACEQATGQTVQYNGLDPMEHIQKGGAFPLILKTGEFVGVAAVSGLPHEKDHQFVVDALAKYLGVADVPKAEI